MGLSDLFGDEGDRDAAMRRAFQQYKSEMNQYIGGFESRFGNIINQVMADRDTDIAAFSAMYQQGIDQYESSMARLEAGFGEARGLLEEGIDQTLEDIATSSEAAAARSMAQGALTGLGGTSFGAAQTEAYRQEGAREGRRAQEQFRGQMADLSLREGASMFEAGAGLSSMITQRATAESDLRRSYTSAISGLQQSLAQQVFGAQQGIAGAGFETDMARAENIGSGFNLGEALVNAGIAYATGGIGSAIGGAVGGAIGAASSTAVSSAFAGGAPGGGGSGMIHSGGGIPQGYSTFTPGYTGQFGGQGYSYQNFN
jgi:hypothetical protein